MLPFEGASDVAAAVVMALLLFAPSVFLAISSSRLIPCFVEVAVNACSILRLRVKSVTLWLFVSSDTLTVSST